MSKQITYDGITYNLVPVHNDELTVMDGGKNYLIRTVTNYIVGMYSGSVDGFAIMRDASWVADTGRFSEAFSKHQFNEVEFVPSAIVRVNLGSVIDIWEWNSKLPTETK